MKKFLLLVLLFVCFFQMGNINFAQAVDENTTYVITANSASIFDLPDFASEKLETLSHNEEVKIHFENSSPKEYENSGYIFYKVINTEGTDGYIYADLITPKQNVITSLPNFNAQTNVENAIVYFKQDNNMVEANITLEKDKRIFLYEGYKNKTEYTAIAFEHDGQIVYGYLKTKDVNPDGINVFIIYAIIIIMAIVGIVFTWLFMRRKKIKLAKKKNLS